MLSSLAPGGTHKCNSQFLPIPNLSFNFSEENQISTKSNRDIEKNATEWRGEG